MTGPERAERSGNLLHSREVAQDVVHELTAGIELLVANGFQYDPRHFRQTFEFNTPTKEGVSSWMRLKRRKDGRPLSAYLSKITWESERGRSEHTRLLFHSLGSSDARVVSDTFKFPFPATWKRFSGDFGSTGRHLVLGRDEMLDQDRSDEARRLMVDFGNGLIAKINQQRSSKNLGSLPGVILRSDT